MQEPNAPNPTQQPDAGSAVPLPSNAPESIPSFRIQRILVPVDFSAASQEALPRAIFFARLFSAQLVLLHVVEFAYLGSELGSTELTGIEAEMQRNAHDQLQALIRQTGQTGFPWDVQVRTGRPYFEILEAARESGVDLILIASHGHSRLAHVLLGSTVERVVRFAPCPVFTFRPKTEVAH